MSEIIQVVNLFRDQSVCILIPSSEFPAFPEFGWLVNSERWFEIRSWVFRIAGSVNNSGLINRSIVRSASGPHLAPHTEHCDRFKMPPYFLFLFSWCWEKILLSLLMYKTKPPHDQSSAWLCGANACIETINKNVHLTPTAWIKVFRQVMWSICRYSIMKQNEQKELVFTTAIRWSYGKADHFINPRIKSDMELHKWSRRNRSMLEQSCDYKPCITQAQNPSWVLKMHYTLLLHSALLPPGLLGL